ncbi:unnamed protein product, partial [Penicillium pancosmium]
PTQPTQPTHPLAASIAATYPILVPATQQSLSLSSDPLTEPLTPFERSTQREMSTFERVSDAVRGQRRGRGRRSNRGSNRGSSRGSSRGSDRGRSRRAHNASSQAQYRQTLLTERGDIQSEGVRTRSQAQREMNMEIVVETSEDSEGSESSLDAGAVIGSDDVEYVG